MIYWWQSNKRGPKCIRSGTNHCNCTIQLSYQLMDPLAVPIAARLLVVASGDESHFRRSWPEQRSSSANTIASNQSDGPIPPVPSAIRPSAIRTRLFSPPLPLLLLIHNVHSNATLFILFLFQIFKTNVMIPLDNESINQQRNWLIYQWMRSWLIPPIAPLINLNWTIIKAHCINSRCRPNWHLVADSSRRKSDTSAINSTTN